MPIVAEAVPGLLHVSLFLFFVGLGDSVLDINTIVGVSTTIPIGINGLLYIFTTFARIIYPQSPYQNSFSGVIWSLIQRLHGRTFKDRSSDGASKSVSRNMSKGQMRLAMEETGDRMMRDEGAIRWLIENSTEESEMELFVAAIPGSFNAEWGIEVWRRVSKIIEDENRTTNWNELTEKNIITPMAPADRPSLRTTPGRNRLVLHPPNTPHPSVMASSQEENLARELCRRVSHLLETCKNRALFASDEQWRKRTRACLETTASLVAFANMELAWFGDVGRLLGDNAGDLLPRVRPDNFRRPLRDHVESKVKSRTRSDKVQCPSAGARIQYVGAASNWDLRTDGPSVIDIDRADRYVSRAFGGELTNLRESV